MTHRPPALAGCLLAMGCTEPAPCPTCDPPERHGALQSPELVELSGLAASALHPDVLYAHNDSGDASRLFALGTNGTHRAIYELSDARNDDWEDLAAAPCAFGSCLYVADVGDNDRTRESYALYVLPEPASIEPGVHAIEADRIAFAYPDGPHDAEALLVHPRTGVVTIVTKEDAGPAVLYELGPLVPNGQLTATRVGELDPDPLDHAAVTGGAVHPDATAIALRTTTRLLRWAMDPDQTVAEALTSAAACPLPSAHEAQGEAVTWLSAGDGLVTIGEGVGAPVHVSACEGA